MLEMTTSIAPKAPTAPSAPVEVGEGAHPVVREMLSELAHVRILGYLQLKVAVAVDENGLVPPAWALYVRRCRPGKDEVAPWPWL